MSLSLTGKTRPTRYELLKLKDRLELARRAHDLLEEKYRMLNLETQKVRNTLNPFEKKLRKEIKEAYRLLLRAIMHVGMRRIELAAKSTYPNDEIEIYWETIHGLSIPRIRNKMNARTPLERGYGVSSTSSSIDDAAEALESVMSLMVTVSELRNTVRILENEVKRTRMRVFALERVLIPFLEKEKRRIEIKLEERDRERHAIWRRTSNNRERQSVGIHPET